MKLRRKRVVYALWLVLISALTLTLIGAVFGFLEYVWLSLSHDTFFKNVVCAAFVIVPLGLALLIGVFGIACAILGFVKRQYSGEEKDEDCF